MSDDCHAGEDVELVDKDALNTLLQWAIEGNSGIDFGNPRHPEVVDAVNQLYQDRYNCHLCELCTFPNGAGYRTPDGTAVCITHANSLESGSWSGEEVDMEPIESREQSPRLR